MAFWSILQGLAHGYISWFHLDKSHDQFSSTISWPHVKLSASFIHNYGPFLIISWAYHASMQTCTNIAIFDIFWIGVEMNHEVYKYKCIASEMTDTLPKPCQANSKPNSIEFLEYFIKIEFLIQLLFVNKNSKDS